MKTKNQIHLILFFLITASLISCSNHLSRDKAKEEIIKKESFPMPILYTFETGYIKDEQSTGGGAVYASIGESKTYEEVKDMLNYFQSNNLIKISEEPHSETDERGWPFSPTTRTWIMVKISLTELGNKYLHSENKRIYIVKLWDKDIDDIRGILEMEQNKVADVTYTTSNKNISPFGEYFNEKSQQAEKHQQFVLYDNGWKISNK